MNWKSIFVRSLGGLLIGAAIALSLEQHDEPFKDFMRDKIQRYVESAFECCASGKITRINFFSPEIHAEGVLIAPRDNPRWRWSIGKCTYRFSWLQLLLHKKIVGYIHLDQFACASEVSQGSVAMVEFLKKITDGLEATPFVMKELVIHDGTMTLHDVQADTRYTLSCNTDLKFSANRLQATMYFSDGAIIQRSTPVVQAAAGKLVFEVDQKTMHSTATIDGTVDLSCIGSPGNMCRVAGSWQKDTGSITLLSPDQTVRFEQMRITKKAGAPDISFTLHGHIPLGVCAHVLLKENSTQLHGDCQINLRGSVGGAKDTARGSIILNECRYKEHEIGTFSTNFTYLNSHAQGDLNYTHTHAGLVGSWEYDQKKQHATLVLTNSSVLSFAPFNPWAIKQEDIHISCTYTQAHALQGNYSAVVTHDKIDARQEVRGTFSCADGAVRIEGSINDNTYVLTGNYLPDLRLAECTYRNPEGKKFITLVGNKDSFGFVGSVDYSLVRRLATQLFEYDTRGQGMINCSGTVENAKLKLLLELSDAHIRLLETYNFIHSLRADIEVDIAGRSVLLHSFDAHMHKGKLHATHGALKWNEAGKCSFLYVPVLVQRILLNADKDLFALVSGDLTLHRKELEPLHIDGNVVLEKSHFKKNIFSDLVQKNVATRMFGGVYTQERRDVLLDISVRTLQPLSVKTSFLDTDARLAFHVQGNLHDPQIGGTITVLGGSLAFPHKPLYIARGSLYFLPGQIADPTIELVAKGKIKKYGITMRVQGSLQHPYIHLESSPPLAEEQIVTLLLAGSEEGSLRIIMPSLIMKNMRNIIFSSEQTPSKLEHYFNNLMTPFKYVRIVPSFSDQTARGGLRGAIEIDVNERLSAVIQKNFSLTEDTKFEVEYLMSDDISVRGLRDERSDLGGEVEMRWKF